MNRREFLELSGGALATAAHSRTLSGAGTGKLNFVFILVDDMGWRDLACYGSTFHETPNIDRLATQGMRFTNAYAAAPLCSPTRASILTGKYPARLHLTMALPGTPRALPSQRLMPPTTEPALPLREVTIAEALKQAGYVSAAVGKWHLGTEQFYPEKQGFDVAIGGTEAMSTRNFFYPGWKGQQRGMTGTPRREEYLTDRLTDEALQFLDRRGDRPFLLYLSHYAVHTPVQGKRELVEKYLRKVNVDQPQHNPVYAAMVESVDQSVGRVMRKLDELGIADNTVVFFMSDNGGVDEPQLYTGDSLPPTSNLPLREGKCTLYEGGIREPLIVRWPGAVKPGSISDVPVISNDFFPTIIEMAGLKADPGNAVDGVSLVSLLRQRGVPDRQALYWHYPHHDNFAVGAMRMGNYKLLEFFEDRRLELYNLGEDIGERNDLARKMPAKTAELHQMLQRWRESVGAQMMTPNPGYRPEASTGQ